MAEALIDRISSAQALLDARKTKEALTQIETLKNEYPTSFSVRLIHANALLLNGEGQKAQSIYNALLSEVPETRTYMKEAIQNIQSRLGKRMPASVGGNQ
jgi:predicted Zn-dependent protease